MDIKREPKSRRRKYLYSIAALVAIIAITVALGRLKPAAPSVERASLWVDSVRRGTMVREVRAPGTLVPEQVRWIPAVTGGRIEQIRVLPGARVDSGTIILEMSNPDVQLAALSAQQQLTTAEAALVNLTASLRSQILAQEAQVATARAAYAEARRNATVYTTLGEQRLASTNETARATEQAGQAATILRTEEGRLAVLQGSLDQQIALQRSQVARLREIVQFQEERLAAMKVRAGAAGQLQDMNLEVGQWVNPGALLAKVAQPGRLKAVLRVPETQAKDVAIGQPTAVDTRNGIVSGRVLRIAPSASNGTVGVEVALEGALPRGARPDLSVDGTIEIERLTNVLYMGRPAYGQEESAVGLFRIAPDGATAERVKVQLGRSSATTIEVRQGLAPGDSVIISDMSQWDNVDRVRIRR